jgi:phenylpyruvate tautomerase PptA (4-oxalocrotonate tautomerase family)
MPLVRIDAIEGRSDLEIKTLLDTAHRAIIKAFHVPERDRYQVYTEHKQNHVVIEDTGLPIPRTGAALIITVFSKTRTQELKTNLYKTLAEELSSACSISPHDVMVVIVENSNADWSFGDGEAQFLNGKLKG